MNSKMVRPDISFIVPVYGVERYLSQCVESIINQTFSNFELILIDDGSPDSCGSICDAYADKDTRVRVIHKQNEGVSAARNDGIAAASGEWAYFVDSDDWLELDAAERLYRAAIENDVDCVMSYAVKRYPDGRAIRSALFAHAFLTRDRKDIEDIQKYVLYQPYSPLYIKETTNGYAAPWAKFVKLRILKENDITFDPYVKGVFDDGIWSLYLLDHVESLMYLHEKTYNYRIVDSSLTNSFKPNAMEIQRRGYERIEEFLTKTNKDRSFWEAYYAHVVVFFGGYLSRYYFNKNNPKAKHEVHKEIVNALHSHPWKEAARGVDFNKLRSKDKILAVCEKSCFTPGLHLYYFAKVVQERIIP